eukprot:3642269-Pleurochrysis_carterae.AAC.1
MKGRGFVGVHIFGHANKLTAHCTRTKAKPLKKTRILRTEFGRRSGNKQRGGEGGDREKDGQQQN